MKRIEISKDIEAIKSDSFTLEENTVVFIPKNIIGIEKDAFKSINGKNALEIEYEGNKDDWLEIARGLLEKVRKISDYSPSYGGGVSSQLYYYYHCWFNNFIEPVVIHCQDCDLEENSVDNGKSYVIERDEWC